MTKDQLSALWEGLPGNTELMIDDSDVDSAHWTFREVDAEVEDLIECEFIPPAIGQGYTFWERPSVRDRLENTKVISDGTVPVIVLK